MMSDTLVFVLNDWAAGCRDGLPSTATDEMIANYEAQALDALVAAGKIKPEDRSRVTFIAYTFVESMHRRANVDDSGSA